jgi:glycosyltransferase involved in cell wall biosynthesis
MVVQNLSALVSKNWTGIGRPAESNVMPKSMQASRTEFNLVTIHDQLAPVILLESDSGAAAARNKGWENAKNDWILFLDDDITISERFLSDVRRYLVGKPRTCVRTFRIRTVSANYLEPLHDATISLDRGPEIRKTGSASLRLQQVWMYGAGAALVSNRAVLESTGGFRNKLGAGCRYGGAEDAAFLWHASFHASIEYDGALCVFHETISDFSQLARKMVEYGRAIGYLGGQVGGADGHQYVTGYCKHIGRVALRKDIVAISAINHSRLMFSIFRAITETLQVYAWSLFHRGQVNVLCENCRRLS